MQVITDNLGFLLGGVGITLGLTAFGFAGALILGTLVAIARVSPIAPLRWFGTLYVEFFKNIPLLSLLVLIVFGLPDAGLTMSLFTSAWVGLALSGSAFLCEAVRGGINGVPVGQAEAARSIGLSFAQSLRLVVLPQAFRTMIQPMVNVAIGVLLSSALAAAVGVDDLTNRTQQLNIEYAEAVVCFLFAGAVYIIFALGTGALGGVVERRLAFRR